MKRIVSKRRINNIKNYFIALYWILEQLFESQFVKIELKLGYDLYEYLQKTEYRIENVCASLKEIMEVTSSEDIKKQIKKKEKEFQICVREYANYEESSKNHIKFFIASILWSHCENIISKIENFDKEELKELLLMVIYENIYEYYSIIHREIKIKYGKTINLDKISKKKAITQRLKKNSWKKLEIK